MTIRVDYQRLRLLWTGAAVLACTCAGIVRAQVVVMPTFSSTTGLTINSAGTATTSDGTILRLVAATSSDAGSAFTTSQFNVGTGFSTAFEFRLSNRGGISDGTQIGADGFVFVVQRDGATSLGGAGGSLGYGGIGSSVGVKFDTFQNGGDLSSNFMSVVSGGSVTAISGTSASVSPDFDNGNKWTAWIDYNGSTLEFRVSTDGTRPASALMTHSINIASTIGGNTAFVGFTAGTGGAWADHDILKWTFSDTFVNGGVMPGLAVPEPPTVALAALGLGVIWWRRRRALW